MSNRILKSCSEGRREWNVLFKAVVSTVVFLSFGILPAPSTYGQSSKQMETIRRIKANDLTFGCWINLTDPAVTEMIANAGFDFNILDLEHGRLNEETCYKLILPLGD